MNADRSIADALLDIGALILRPDEPFQWSSGLKAPIYCDNRLTLAYPDLRRQISKRFAQMVRRHGMSPNVVVGTATAGIPHAAWLADRLTAPMAYVRGRAKGHGRENKIEGRVESGDRVVVVEDLISTGGSVLDVVETLRRADAVVAGIVAIFSYGFDETIRRMKEAQVDCFTLTSFDAVVAQGVDRGDISTGAAERLEQWRQDPRRWSASVTA